MLKNTVSEFKKCTRGVKQQAWTDRKSQQTWIKVIWNYQVWTAKKKNNREMWTEPKRFMECHHADPIYTVGVPDGGGKGRVIISKKK